MTTVRMVTPLELALTRAWNSVMTVFHGGLIMGLMILFATVAMGFALFFIDFLIH